MKLLPGMSGMSEREMQEADNLEGGEISHIVNDL